MMQGPALPPSAFTQAEEGEGRGGASGGGRKERPTHSLEGKSRKEKGGEQAPVEPRGGQRGEKGGKSTHPPLQLHKKRKKGKKKKKKKKKKENKHRAAR